MYNVIMKRKLLAIRVELKFSMKYNVTVTEH